MTPLCDDTAGKKQRYISRRDFWSKAGMGIGGLAIADLLARDGLLAASPSIDPKACLGSEGITDSPYLPKPPHFKPRAKSVIHLFMSGGVSQPAEKRNVSTVPTQALTLLNGEFALMQSGYLADRVIEESSSDPAARAGVDEG